MRAYYFSPDEIVTALARLSCAKANR
jgi:hypothetical protein